MTSQDMTDKMFSTSIKLLEIKTVKMTKLLIQSTVSQVFCEMECELFPLGGMCEILYRKIKDKTRSESNLVMNIQMTSWWEKVRSKENMNQPMLLWQNQTKSEKIYAERSSSQMLPWCRITEPGTGSGIRSQKYELTQGLLGGNKINWSKKISQVIWYLRIKKYTDMKIRSQVIWYKRIKKYLDKKIRSCEYELNPRSSGSNLITWSHSRKARNIYVKAYNGNIASGNTIKIGHWNIGSRFWRNKTVEMQHMVDEVKPDMIFVSEANLLSSTSEEEKNIAGYTITTTKDFRNSGISQLVLLIRDNFEVETQMELMENDIASIWVKIPRRGNRRLILGGMYREHKLIGDPTDARIGGYEHQAARWRAFIEQWKRADKLGEVHVIGDLNVDMMKWDRPEYATAPLVDMLKEEIVTLGYSQLVKGPTRFWPGTRDSLVDVVWTKCPDKILQCNNRNRSVADHNFIKVVMRVKGQGRKPAEYIKRCWKNSSPEQLRQELEAVNWNDIYDLEDPTLANSFLEENVLQVLDKLAPNKVIQTSRSHKKWVSAETKEMIRNRDEVREKARMTGSQVHWDQYRNLRNICTSRVRKDKDTYFKRLYDECETKGDVKKLFRIMKEQLGWETAGPPTALRSGETVLNKPEDIANAQMDAFEGKIKKLNQDLPPSNSDPVKHLEEAMRRWRGAYSRSVMEIREVTVVETLEAIRSLSDSPAQGDDKLDAISLKAAAGILAAPINHITNLSITKTTFCSKWKLGKLVPLYKGKALDRMDTAAYRPIALLPVVSKVVERQVHKQVLEYMETSEQLKKDCHAYRKYMGTTTAMNEVVDNINKAANERRIADVMTIDMSAAFDCVRHDVLDKKLAVYNFSEKSRAWFRSYLSFRSHYVSIGTKKSRIKMTQQGVPQGSILGPLIYVIYMNELPAVVKTPEICYNPEHEEDEEDEELFGDNCKACVKMTCYADDCTYVTTASGREENQVNLTRNLDRISDFLTSNGMSINPTKTTISEHMVQQRRTRTPGSPPTPGRAEERRR